MKHETLLRVLGLFSRDDSHDTLYWSGDPLQFYAQVNDIFAWGVADLEEITEDTVDELERACQDLAVVGVQGWLAELYTARQRGMRPQGAAYGLMNEKVWPLFDAAGYPREVGLGNPKPHPLEED